MKPWFMAGMLAMVAVPATPAAPLTFADGETRYACGKRCPAVQLVCMRDAQQDAPTELTPQDIATNIPSGQTDFWFMTGTISDRPAAGIVDARRSKGPAVVSFAGLDWVWADYDLLAAGGPDLAGSLLMWPDGDQLAMLRCSFLPHERARTMIEKLAGSLRR
jgi:hypothetical protein